MFLIEKISKTLAEKIGVYLDIEDDKREVIAYGAFNLLQTLLGITMVVFISGLVGVLVQALIISFAISYLRKYSGGVHSSSPNRCALIGAFISTGLGYIIKYFGDVSILYSILFVLLGFIFSYLVIIKLAPVDSPAKPIRREETRKRLRRKSIITLCILFGISSFLVIVSLFICDNIDFKLYSLCISAGAVWQAFTLTRIGHVVLNRIDILFKYIKI